MSKIKSPQDKKTLSLSRDRRNTYGENPAASRQGIRRGKQRSHMGERRAVNQILGHLRESAAEDDATEADVQAKTSIVKSKRKAFRKLPDSPLGAVIERKLAQRTKRATTRPIHAFQFVSFKFHGLFDTPYNSRFHKHSILDNLRYLTGVRGRWQTKKTRTARKLEHDDATSLKEAILRDAPLLRGFFAEEPGWREKALLWCDRVLSNVSESNKYK